MKVPPPPDSLALDVGKKLLLSRHWSPTPKYGVRYKE